MFKDQWREQGPYVEKPPFPKPKTEVRCKELERDDDSGTVTLRLTPVNGDTIHYEVGAKATPSSLKVPDANKFQTSEMEVHFLCVDSKGEHDTGEESVWKNRITLKHRVYQAGENKMVELRAAPQAPIRYTTDGSDPKAHGGVYDGPFVVAKGTVYVLACAEKAGVVSEVYKIPISWDKDTSVVIDKTKPALWRRSHKMTTTLDSYAFLERVKKHTAQVYLPRLAVAGSHWVELNVDEHISLTGEKLESTLEHLRGLLSDGQVEMDAKALRFPTGQHFLDWVAEVKTEIKPGEVEQE